MTVCWATRTHGQLHKGRLAIAKAIPKIHFSPFPLPTCQRERPWQVWLMRGDPGMPVCGAKWWCSQACTRRGQQLRYPPQCSAASIAPAVSSFRGTAARTCCVARMQPRTREGVGWRCSFKTVPRAGELAAKPSVQCAPALMGCILSAVPPRRASWLST